jgi:N6-L-threonylcarbamoyladenine synthase
MITLGIESTAHTFGCAVVKNGAVLCNVKDSYTTKTGGIIPADLSEHHMGCFDTVLRNSLEAAKISIRDVDVIAFSQGPGIGHALRIGTNVARSLALHHKLPLVGVNHCKSLYSPSRNRQNHKS